jgi:hypothetical protein
LRNSKDEKKSKKEKNLKKIPTHHSLRERTRNFRSRHNRRIERRTQIFRNLLKQKQITPLDKIYVFFPRLRALFAALSDSVFSAVGSTHCRAK